MKDEEIRTKTLSDWKPETDIKLQKAFGKFVEEAGELLKVISGFLKYENYGLMKAFEEELADCKATARMIHEASEGRISIYPSYLMVDVSVKTHVDAMTSLLPHISDTLTIVGRCQIQGLKGADPETKTLNAVTLEENLKMLVGSIDFTIRTFEINSGRILSREAAKIDSKLPWVMGTATDLLPDD